MTRTDSKKVSTIAVAGQSLGQSRGRIQISNQTNRKASCHRCKTRLQCTTGQNRTNPHNIPFFSGQSCLERYVAKKFHCGIFGRRRGVSHSQLIINTTVKHSLKQLHKRTSCIKNKYIHQKQNFSESVYSGVCTCIYIYMFKFCNGAPAS